MTASSRRSFALFSALIAVFLFSSGCSLVSPDKTPGRDYSLSFAAWFYPSNNVGVELVSLREAIGGPADEGSLRLRLQELATTQASLNARFREAAPPEQWQQSHQGIIDATKRYESAVAEAQNPGSSQPLQALVDLFDSQERTLMDSVIGCYTHTSLCTENALR